MTSRRGFVIVALSAGISGCTRIGADDSSQTQDTDDWGSDRETSDHGESNSSKTSDEQNTSSDSVSEDAADGIDLVETAATDPVIDSWTYDTDDEVAIVNVHNQGITGQITLSFYYAPDADPPEHYMTENLPSGVTRFRGRSWEMEADEHDVIQASISPSDDVDPEDFGENLAVRIAGRGHRAVFENTTDEEIKRTVRFMYTHYDTKETEVDDGYSAVVFPPDETTTVERVFSRKPGTEWDVELTN